MSKSMTNPMTNPRAIAASAVALATAIMACGLPTTTPPPEVRSCETRHLFAVDSLDGLDVLLVVDDSAGMAAFPDAAGELALGALAVDEWECHRLDLHIGVITGDPADDGFMVGSPPYLQSRDRPGGIARNFTGSVRDAVEARIPRDHTGSPEQKPLAMALRALDGRNPGFRREHAWLFVVFVTATDDGSPEPIADYADRLRGLATHPASVVVAATDQPAGSAPRMTAFLDAFPQRSSSGSLHQSGGVLELFSQLLWCLLEHFVDDMCVADLEPGVEQCVVTERTFAADGTERERLVPACSETPSDDPCWRIEMDEACVDRGGYGARLVVDRTEYPSEPTVLDLRCEVCALP